MKKNQTKQQIKLSALFLVLTLLLSPVSVYAQNSLTAYTYLECNRLTPTPHTNITGYKYKTVDGIRWKRLWSYTYHRWEDPHWTLA